MGSLVGITDAPINYEVVNRLNSDQHVFVLRSLSCYIHDCSICFFEADFYS